MREQYYARALEMFDSGLCYGITKDGEYVLNDVTGNLNSLSKFEFGTALYGDILATAELPGLQQMDTREFTKEEILDKVVDLFLAGYDFEVYSPAKDKVIY